MVPDPHRVLGVARCADAAEIRRAYRALVKQVHPDVEGGDARRFAHVQEAYAQLLGRNDEPRPEPPGPVRLSFGFSIRLGPRRRGR